MLAITVGKPLVNAVSLTGCSIRHQIILLFCASLHPNKVVSCQKAAIWKRNWACLYLFPGQFTDTSFVVARFFKTVR